MAKPYSLDLRERVVAAVEREGLSHREAGERYDLAPSTVGGWIRRRRKTGSVAPGQMGGQKPRTIRDGHRDWLIARCLERDFTLRGLVEELAAERGLKVDYRSVWEFVHAEDLSFKKNRARQRAGSARRRAPPRAVDPSPGAD
jgi:putative transposase